MTDSVPASLPSRSRWEELRGDAFVVDLRPADGIVLTLAEVRGPSSHEFALLFHGPPEPLLDQGIRRLHSAATGPLDVFLVAVGRDAETARYEAVFNLQSAPPTA